MKKQELWLTTLISQINLRKTLETDYLPEALVPIALQILASRVSSNELKRLTLNISKSEIPKLPKTVCTEFEFRTFIQDYLKINGVNASSLLFNSHDFAQTTAIYVYGKACEMMKAADLTLSMGMEAIRGEMGAFDDRLHSIGRPYLSQINSANNVRKLLKDSEMATPEGRLAFGYDKTDRVQDAISFRAAAQTHGGVRDTLSLLRDTLDKYIETPTVYAHQLRYAFNFLMIGLADMANISERRAFRLTNTELSYGLPTNLVYENPGWNHGFPVIQAASTAVLGELKTLATPSSLSVIEIANTCVPLNTGLRCIECLSLLSKVLGIELYMSAQGMDLVKLKLPNQRFGNGTDVAHAYLRESVDVVKTNRHVIPDMIKVDELIFSGTLIAHVETNIGKLE